jgi:hypothetical protein
MNTLTKLNSEMNDNIQGSVKCSLIFMKNVALMLLSSLIA